MKATMGCLVAAALGGAGVWGVDTGAGPAEGAAGWEAQCEAARAEAEAQQRPMVEGQLVDMYSAGRLMSWAGRVGEVPAVKLPYFDARDESASLAGPSSGPRLGEVLSFSKEPPKKERYFDAQAESASLAGPSSSLRWGEDMHGQGVASYPLPYFDARDESASLAGRTSSPVMGDERIAAANGKGGVTYRIPAPAATLDIDAAQSRERLAAGIPAAIYTGGKLYTLACDPKEVAGYAGEKIRVAGTLDEAKGTLAVERLEVQREGRYEDVAVTPTTMPAGPSGTAIEK